MRVICVAAGLMAVALISPAPMEADVYCSKPVTPFCLNREATYTNEQAQADCREQLDSFAGEMQEYVGCLGRKAEEAQARVEELRRRYACMARGQSDCP